MSVAPERQLLEGLRQHLADDLGVKACLGDPPRLHDVHPSPPVFPYVTWGDVTSSDAGAAAAPALRHDFTLHVWSRDAGRKEALDCVDALRTAIAAAPQTMGPLRIVFMSTSFADVLRAGDGRTFHGVLRARAITE